VHAVCGVETGARVYEAKVVERKFRHQNVLRVGNDDRREEK
jgi:hypothetical protein